MKKTWKSYKNRASQFAPGEWAEITPQNRGLSSCSLLFVHGGLLVAGRHLVNFCGVTQLLSIEMIETDIPIPSMGLVYLPNYI